MSSDLDQRAKDAFIDESFELAVDLFTQAISLSPTQAELYADRAQANIKLLNFPEAVADAQRAIELDASMAKAYYRKGVACMNLEEYQTAKAALETGAALARGESKFVKLIQQCDEKIAEEMNDTPKPFEAPSNASTVKLAQPVDKVITQAPSAAPSRPKYRHEFYQNPVEVVVTVFAIGVPASCVSVDYGDQILSVSINVPGEDPYHFQPRLFGKIIPDKCKLTVLSGKVEIRLAKTEPLLGQPIRHPNPKQRLGQARSSQVKEEWLPRSASTINHQQPQLVPLPATRNNIDFGPPPPPRLANNMGIRHQSAQVGHQVPRSWYKCSSSRGCPARKQVERRSDNPDIFAVSSAGDHRHHPPSHRNSLAGTSRLKLSSSSAAAGREYDAADATSADSQSLNQKDLNQVVNV